MALSPKYKTALSGRPPIRTSPVNPTTAGMGAGKVSVPTGKIPVSTGKILAPTGKTPIPAGVSTQPKLPESINKIPGFGQKTPTPSAPIPASPKVPINLPPEAPPPVSGPPPAPTPPPIPTAPVVPSITPSIPSSTGVEPEGVGTRSPRTYELPGSTSGRMLGARFSPMYTGGEEIRPFMGGGPGLDPERRKQKEAPPNVMGILEALQKRR